MHRLERAPEADEQSVRGSRAAWRRDSPVLLASVCVCSHLCSWRQGLADWVPLSSVPELRGIFATAFDAPDEVPVTAGGKKGGAAAAGRNNTAAASGGAATAASSSSSSSAASAVDPLARWFYLDKYRVQQGPVRKDEIVRLYKMLQLNDASMVWSDEVAGAAAAAASSTQAWMRLAECPAFDGLIGPEVLEASRAERDAFLASQAAEKEKKRKRAAASSASTSKWKKGNTNHSNVYFTGLPLDVTPEELFEVARKAGIILTDEANGGARRIKIYTDEHGKNKGDALVKYALPDSVQLAIDLLDGSVFRPAKSKLNPSNEPVIIHVEKAEFSMHGASFDESKMDARAKEKAAIKRAKLAGGSAAAEAAKAQVGALTAAEIARQKLAESLSWGDEDAYGSTTGGSSKLRIVILKPMFSLAEAAAHEEGAAAYYRELKEEIGAEVEAKVSAAVRAAAGEQASSATGGAPACIEKLTVFAGNPEGPVAIKFRSSAHAAACISLMNGRLFAGSKLSAFYFDGKTNYVVDTKGSKEDEAETERRLKEFGDWIEGDAEAEDEE